MSPGLSFRFDFSSPVRMAGPCVSSKMATAHPISFAIRRMRGMISRTHSCFAWLMLSRKMSAPASSKPRNVPVFSVAGPSVQMIFVLSDPYDWKEIAPESAEVIVAGQTFEHTEFFWETARQITRTLKPGGLCCIIVPSSGPEHRFPVDCWRMYPDGLRALARYAGLE